MGRYLDVAKKINNPSALTQEQGDLVYAEIEDAFDNNETIVLDFVNVESMISPFLNNAIGQLYGKYTSEKIQACLKLKNFPPSKNSTLNIVINNAKKFYSNREGFSHMAKEVLNIE